MFKNLYSNEPGLLAVLAYIEEADCNEIDLIIDSVTRRYSRFHPDYDISFLSLPKEPKERKKQLEQLLEQIKAGQLL